MLTKEQVEEFRQIWKEEFGEEISYEYAEEKGERLVELMRLICSGKRERERKMDNPTSALDISSIM
ncbi:MAG: hypothetical protein WCT23_08535 [Candidatus Neomarinimicrobiota bacterium]